MNLSEAKGLYTIVAIKGNKVVEQMRDIEKKELKDAISFMKKAHKGAKISVEDSKGKVVKTESYINRFRDSSFLDELFGRRKSKKNNKIKDNSPLVIRGQGDYKKVTRPSDLRRKTKKESVELDEVSPPGWENTVKKMKKHKDIDNPWALAWYMKNKGYTPKGREKS